MEKTLIEITDELRKEGYTEDFNLKENCLECRAGDFELFHHEFHVDKFFRLEGESDPSDSVIIYAISALTNGSKGVLVNSYGIYADAMASEMMEKLAFKN
ncbi:MAG: phosphoribosylpyrophosphate synthetase [Lewinellaceae bacterium]|nr:phosphoribosylpyrophosphate synthetase [Lewinellaceae bacterium]